MTDTERHDLRIEELRDARVRQETRRGKGLLDLLDKRPELREVCPLADLVGERLLWSA
jgi:hypothetical protein